MHWDGGDGGDGDRSDVLIILIKHRHHTCFHTAVTCGNNDIENAKAVCCRTVLYRMTQGDADVYFAILDVRLQVVYFCLCSPSQQEFEDASQHFMQGQAGRVIKKLKTHIASNADVLSKTGMTM